MAARLASWRLVSAVTLRKPTFRAASSSSSSVNETVTEQLKHIKDFPIRHHVKDSHLRRLYVSGESLDGHDSASDDHVIEAVKSKQSTGYYVTSDEKGNEVKYAAFLGEADSDDGHETNVNLFPEQYEHKLEDVGASGLHGSPGEGDEPIEREPPQMRK